MPNADHQSSFLNRISIRRPMMEETHDEGGEGLELFQKHVSELFTDLLPVKPTNTPLASSNNDGVDDLDIPPNILSISWFRKLLDSFLCCEAEFKAVVVMGREPSQFHKPPLDRLIPELLDRTIKALDICNAVTNSIDLVRQWQRLAEVVVSCLEQRPVSSGQVERAKKALNNLLMSMAYDEKQNGFQGKSTERSWSFGRRGTSASNNKDRTGGTFRSMSWSIAKSWSSSKQIQAMSTNLVAPRGEQTGLALPVFVMSTALVFVMWSLVAALPCQERTGLSTHFQNTKQLVWAQPLMGLHDKIVEEWKKKEKKGNAGLLEEVQKMEKLAQSLVEFTESFEYPLDEEKGNEIAEKVTELAEICSKMDEGLMPLQHQVREVFHRIVRSRAEILEIVDQGAKAPLPPLPF